MDDHKYLLITGEVIYRGSPVNIPEKRYKPCYFTVKCVSRKYNKVLNAETVDDYFTIMSYSEAEVEKFREGYIINFLARIETWMPRNEDGSLKFRDDFRKSIYYGKYPPVYTSFVLSGEITVISDNTNKEEIKDFNKDFEDDLPF